jgi:hypothetical protein
MKSPSRPPLLLFVSNFLMDMMIRISESGEEKWRIKKLLDVENQWSYTTRPPPARHPALNILLVA